MKKPATRVSDLASLHALGVLEGQESESWAALLAESAQARGAAQNMAEVTEALARSLPPVKPSIGLKGRILEAAESAKARRAAETAMKQLVPASQEGLSFIRQASGPGWLPLPVAGAFVKLLSFDETSGYAVVLGKLEPGARYPAHRHHAAEDIFMLSGDLHVGEHLIQEGDFHHAEAGSQHGVNWSEKGCVLLAVLSREDLLAQLSEPPLSF